MLENIIKNKIIEVESAEEEMEALTSLKSKKEANA